MTLHNIPFSLFAHQSNFFLKVFPCGSEAGQPPPPPTHTLPLRQVPLCWRNVWWRGGKDRRACAVERPNWRGNGGDRCESWPRLTVEQGIAQGSWQGAVEYPRAYADMDSASVQSTRPQDHSNWGPEWGKVDLLDWTSLKDYSGCDAAKSHVCLWSYCSWGLCWCLWLMWSTQRPCGCLWSML